MDSCHHGVGGGNDSDGHDRELSAPLIATIVPRGAAGNASAFGSQTGGSPLLKVHSRYHNWLARHLYHNPPDVILGNAVTQLTRRGELPQRGQYGAQCHAARKCCVPKCPMPPFFSLTMLATTAAGDATEAWVEEDNNLRRAGPFSAALVTAIVSATTLDSS